MAVTREAIDAARVSLLTSLPHWPVYSHGLSSKQAGVPDLVI